MEASRNPFKNVIELYIALNINSENDRFGVYLEFIKGIFIKLISPIPPVFPQMFRVLVVVIEVPISWFDNANIFLEPKPENGSWRSAALLGLAFAVEVSLGHKFFPLC